MKLQKKGSAREIEFQWKKTGGTAVPLRGQEDCFVSRHSNEWQRKRHARWYTLSYRNTGDEGQCLSEDFSTRRFQSSPGRDEKEQRWAAIAASVRERNPGNKPARTSESKYRAPVAGDCVGF